MSRLLLDTGVIIGFERGTLRTVDVLTPDDDVALTVITASELLHGAERADAVHRASRTAWVEGILASFSIEEITLPIARVHAALAAHSQNQGRLRSTYRRHGIHNGQNPRHNRPQGQTRPTAGRTVPHRVTAVDTSCA